MTSIHLAAIFVIFDECAGPINQSPAVKGLNRYGIVKESCSALYSECSAFQLVVFKDAAAMFEVSL